MNKIIKIFLADDDEDDRMMFEEALNETSLGSELYTAADGEKLLRLLAAHSDALPDLIFLDLNMPCKNGKECLKEIRSHAAYASVPVVIYSTSTNDSDIDETFHLGANLYFEKPSSYSVLIGSLSDILAFEWTQHPPRGKRDEFIFKVVSTK
jgi:CheY-like chemotaxis protein